MRRLIVALLFLLALAAVPAVAGAQSSGPCIPGQAQPVCQFWAGRVTFVADGDTIDVDLAGDGSADPVRVRITGLNAMEQSVYSHDPAVRQGECHALEATARLEQLIQSSGNIVRLAAIDPKDTSGVRLRREVSIITPQGWQDVGATMVAEGHALWMPSLQEYAWNREYSTLAQRAAAQQIGIWNPAGCGFGPPAVVRLWVNWNADGNDGRNVDDEWVKIENLDPATDVPLDGWTLRDSSARRYPFPAGAVVPAGGILTVHVGASPFGELGMWLTSPLFDNVGYDQRAMGDGAYLFDPLGNMRAYMSYPCRESCTDPLAGKVDITVVPRGRESIRLRNVSSGPIDLEGYRLGTAQRGYFIGQGSVLQPGETLRIDVGTAATAADTRLARRWVNPNPIFRDGGDKVTLSTYTDITVACDAWGSASC